MLHIKEILFLLMAALELSSSAKVVCYWNGKSFWREGTAKVTIEEIKHGLTYCTHLIYGFAAIDDDDYTIEPIDKKLDLDKGKGQYRSVSTLKRSFPGLSILLSVGGYEDHEEPQKYFDVLEKQEKRTKFVNSVHSLLKEYSFDGIDLAWQFPPQHEKFEKTSIASIWHKLKKTFGVGVDGNAAEHKAQFTSLVSEMKAKLRPDGKLVTIGVLPHVNASTYMDIKGIINNIDFVNLWTFDMRTPERSPEKADYSAPLHYVYDRKPFQNADWVIQYWLQNGADSQKLVMGIPTYGRSWKMTDDSPSSGVPPLLVDGPGKKGPYTKEEGMRAYYETCVHLVSPTSSGAPNTALRRIPEPSKKLGSYAFRTPNSEKKEGMWVSFEEPETAAYKALYAKMKNLGGIAVVDMGLDDTRGLCDGTKFPILRAAKLNIDYIPPPPPMPPPGRIFTNVAPQQPVHPTYPGVQGPVIPGVPGPTVPGVLVPTMPGVPGHPTYPGNQNHPTYPGVQGHPTYPGVQGLPPYPGQPNYPGHQSYIPMQPVYPVQPGLAQPSYPVQPGYPGYYNVQSAQQPNFTRTNG